MTRKVWGNLALVAASTGPFLLILELLARQLYPVPPLWREPQVTHHESPLLGWVLPPGLEAYTIDAPVRVNSLGYRDDEFTRAKAPGDYRILALGDSFTFALGVAFEDLWVQQLERSLNERDGTTRVQVINAGVAGYNTRQELLSLEADGWDLEPDLVIGAFYRNDLIGNDAPLPDVNGTPKIEPHELAWERGARRQEHLIPAYLRVRVRQSVLLYQLVIRIQQLRSASQPAMDSYSVVQQALLAGDDDVLTPYFAATEQRLRQIAGSAAERDVPVILLVFPMENEIRFEYRR